MHFGTVKCQRAFRQEQDLHGCRPRDPVDRIPVDRKLVDRLQPVDRIGRKFTPPGGRPVDRLPGRPAARSTGLPGRPAATGRPAGQPANPANPAG
jgi:hypothetical protein